MEGTNHYKYERPYCNNAETSPPWNVMGLCRTWNNAHETSTLPPRFPNPFPFLSPIRHSSILTMAKLVSCSFRIMFNVSTNEKGTIKYHLTEKVVQTHLEFVSQCRASRRYLWTWSPFIFFFFCKRKYSLIQDSVPTKCQLMSLIMKSYAQTSSLTSRIVKSLICYLYIIYIVITGECSQWAINSQLQNRSTQKIYLNLKINNT